MRRENLNPAIQLTKEQEKEMLLEIQSFYSTVREEQIGVIASWQIMELFLERLAPLVYNKALDDAQKWYKVQMCNMEVDFYELYKNR